MFFLCFADTVHLGTNLVNDQLDAQLLCIYFTSLHVYSKPVLIIRGINCINTTSGICQSVCPDLHTRRSPTQSDIYQKLYWYNWFSWWWAWGCSKHVEKWNKCIRIVRQVDHLQELFTRFKSCIICMEDFLFLQLKSVQRLRSLWYWPSDNAHVILCNFLFKKEQQKWQHIFMPVSELPASAPLPPPPLILQSNCETWAMLLTLTCNADVNCDAILRKFR
jgi:hypothetical protein